jgi:hypothetical protein
MRASRDLEKSRRFYDAVLGALGYGEGQSLCAVYRMPG